MDIRNCSRCGRIYAYDGINKLCPKCRKEEEEEFKRVKEYIYDHPDANIQMVSEETGVPVKKILRYLREGKLELKTENNLLLACERCGKPIKTGRFCDKCIVELKRELKSAVAKKDNIRRNKEKDKMYIAERYKK
ncbi:TIGR03826 family flagellar region protein [Caloranaerobacter azorensis]|uniref:Flagellar operon protein TIGR03826 n=3 Tax=Caloranaerobacter azorensis TaxID=116090 RepID=A0A1M5V3V4_9FIRM|nr:TIGR03826 family flagellar region protein [Caloranaerobacter azorensis]KGG79975.1 MerR family transcriptional regulator [Caloranaerobacter azorensis H53214]QIB27515.1 MerR family transcriptional regulator [Caloranaerobacter azorensis]SHH69942.1 flagellar operon protein TIGR03826 [Caloranaerobacter azorensis DSM 13643]